MMLVFQLTIISFLKEYYTEENGCSKAALKGIKGKKKKKKELKATWQHPLLILP